MKPKTRTPTSQSRGPLVLGKHPASTRKHFKGSGVFAEKAEFLIKAETWREGPLARFLEFTAERLGREGSSFRSQKSEVSTGTDTCGDQRAGRPVTEGSPQVTSFCSCLSSSLGVRTEMQLKGFQKNPSHGLQGPEHSFPRSRLLEVILSLRAGD
ncbi:hypothetical protein HJG60_008532 [Phyllostomus discolor]|uniref:Uncharacterized protein n=1 Tax=Phyllostomus discolor TaxID=89673 RepID=A0A833Z099_9CHIR|nr:hypothetical protein HJG60_008532 [Phyllostomus discolor]